MGNEVRERILGRLLKVIALVGVVAYVPSVYLSVRYGLWYLVLVDSLAFATIVALALAKGISYRLRIDSLVGGFLLISAAVTFATGPFGAGYIFLICAVFLAALLGERRLIVATIVAAASITLGFGLYLALGHPSMGQTLGSFVIVAANLLFVCVLLGVAARSTIVGLQTAYAEEKRLASRVGEELEAARRAEAALQAEMGLKEGLLKELEHRVRNNMQVVQSLLTIEDARRDSLEGDGKSVARLSRRVRSLSLANDMLLSAPDARSVDLHHLLVASLVEHSVGGGGGFFHAKPFYSSLPADQVAGIALVLGDIIASLAALGLPIEITLEAEEGLETLGFSWRSPDAVEDPASGLRADPLLSSLLSGCVLGFTSGEPGEPATLSLGIPLA